MAAMYMRQPVTRSGLTARGAVCAHAATAAEEPRRKLLRCTGLIILPGVVILWHREEVGAANETQRFSGIGGRRAGERNGGDAAGQDSGPQGGQGRDSLRFPGPSSERAAGGRGR